MITRKLVLIGVTTGLLVACGGGGGGGSGSVSSGGSGGTGTGTTFTVSPLDAVAASIAAGPADATPVASAKLPESEVDTLNPSAGSVQLAVGETADAQPIPPSALPAVEADPEKPNS